MFGRGQAGLGIRAETRQSGDWHSQDLPRTILLMRSTKPRFTNPWLAMKIAPGNAS
jgi:hypothetical protein